MRGHGAQASASSSASARAVEQGALIVAAPRGGTQVILQMPRGNLEAVNHRVLVMALIHAALEVTPGVMLVLMLVALQAGVENILMLHLTLIGSNLMEEYVPNLLPAVGAAVQCMASCQS